MMRRIICVLLGAVSGGFAYWSTVSADGARDFAQLWFAARVLLDGGDVYAAIGPGRAFDWPAGLLYPMPAVLLAVPVAPLPVEWACAVFVGIAGGMFAWVLTRDGYGPLLAFAGIPLWFSAEVAQWSPLLAAAVALPAVGVAFAAKPTIGAAIFAARPSWWPITGGLALVALSFAVAPGWVDGWREALAITRLTPGAERLPYVPPVLVPGGVLVLAGLARWRRWEARLLVGLACVPQTLLLYETVPLFLLARTWREATALAALSWGVFAWVRANAPYAGIPAYVEASGQAIVLGLYLPALCIVLLRPNQGPAPAWLERAIAGAPRWLRGQSAVDSHH